MSTEQISRIKNLQSRIYCLTPVELAELIKLKAQFVEDYGIYLEDSILSKDEEDIKNLLLNSQKTLPQKSEDIPTKELIKEFPLDFDEERSEIRKQFFNTSTKITISQSGKTFQTKTDNQLGNIKINIPSAWEVSLEHSLLLRLYDTTFKSKNNNVSEKTDEGFSIVGMTNSLLERHKEFNTVVRIVKAEIDNDPTLVEEIDDNFFKILPNIAVPTAIVLYSLKDMIASGAMDVSEAKEILGFRNRLVFILEDIIS